MLFSGMSSSDWVKGVGFSLLASVIGGASKLAIRKSWLMVEKREHELLDSSDAAFSAEEHASQSPADQTQAYGDFRLMESAEVESSGSNLPSTNNLGDFFDSSTMALRSRDTHRRITQSVTDTPGRNQSQEDFCEDDDQSVEQPLSKYRLALILRDSGMVGMSIFNPLCCVLAMNYASPSILAPFSGLTTVWIVLLSYPVIGERPSMTQAIAALLIVCGEVIVAVFGDHTNDEGLTVHDVWNSYKKGPFIAYFAGIFVWMLLLSFWMKRCSSQSMLHRFAWGVSGGSVTGLQNFLKDALTVLKASSHRPLPALFYALFVFAGASAFGGLLLLTACMKRYDATYSSAMFVGSFVVSASVMSAVHYQTFEHLDGTAEYVLYPAGLVVLMAGVYLLVTESSGRDNVVTDDEERAPLHVNLPSSRSSVSRRPLVSSLEEDNDSS